EKEVIADIISFLAQRSKSVLQEMGFAKGEIEACFTVHSDDFYDLFQRLKALHDFRKENSSFQSLIEVHKRCQGQINGLKRQAFKESLLVEKEERELYSALQNQEKQFSESLLKREYIKVCSLLSELQPPLAALFDKVKILSDDEMLKINRLALLQQVAELFAKVADFQKIQEK
ncbi:MAG TPA: DALR anticodon-binding domain-containing protein, partial [Chlamydiales bacterium]|nr:DALR anticodon-binding domain-containing protein [Chlamydiales bacterium]